MAFEEKFSQMLIAVGVGLLQSVDSKIQLQMQAHLDPVKAAWNTATKSGEERNRELQRFMFTQKSMLQALRQLKAWNEK